MNHQLRIGEQVDVHTNFEDSWVAGYEIAELTTKGW